MLVQQADQGEPHVILNATWGMSAKKFGLAATLFGKNAVLEGETQGFDMRCSYSANELLEWQARSSHRILKKIEAAGKNRNVRKLAWSWADIAESMAIAFEKTGDDRFLHFFGSDFARVCNLRDTVFGMEDWRRERVIPAWGDATGPNGNWEANPTIAGRIVYPAAEFARMIKCDVAKEAHLDLAAEFTATASRSLEAFEQDYRYCPQGRLRFQLQVQRLM